MDKVIHRKLYYYVQFVKELLSEKSELGMYEGKKLECRKKEILSSILNSHKQIMLDLNKFYNCSLHITNYFCIFISANVMQYVRNPSWILTWIISSAPPVAGLDLSSSISLSSSSKKVVKKFHSKHELMLQCQTTSKAKT